jgi:hypothetical protein
LKLVTHVLSHPSADISRTVPYNPLQEHDLEGNVGFPTHGPSWARGQPHPLGAVPILHCRV